MKHLTQKILRNTSLIKGPKKQFCWRTQVRQYKLADKTDFLHYYGTNHPIYQKVQVTSSSLSDDIMICKQKKCKMSFCAWKNKKQTIEISPKIKTLLVDSTSLKSGKNKKQY